MQNIDELKNEKGEIEKENIVKIIPYDESFLFLDKILSLDKKNIVAEVSAKLEQFQGHFSEFPIMPGALIVEGLGQAATMLVRYNIDNHLQKEVLAYKIRKAKFMRPTFPGQKLKFEAKLVFKFKMAWFVNGLVTRDGKPVAEVKMVLAVVNREKFRSRSK